MWDNPGGMDVGAPSRPDIAGSPGGDKSGAASRPLLLFAGPTASGKSAAALAAARARGGVIVNADASQLYADIPLVSAAPGPAELAAVPHRLFGLLDGAVACTAARWAAMARAEIEGLWREGRVPILVGGTGLYLRTLLDGIAPVPRIDAQVREGVRALPPAEARAALEREDPAMAARLHPNDAQRNARALEVVRATGRSLMAWQEAPPQGGLLSQGAAPVALEAHVLDVPRAELVRRIDARVEAMWAAGALDEVRRLDARGLSENLPVMRAIGVPPLRALLHGRLTREAALARWKLDTRQYAKRQATWARNQTGHWPRIAA
jgi:tRNA dimethylallyltransferase